MLIIESFISIFILLQSIIVVEAKNTKYTEENVFCYWIENIRFLGYWLDKTTLQDKTKRINKIDSKQIADNA